MLMWFWKIGFDQLIHEGFFFSEIRRGKVYSINKGVGRIRIVRLEASGWFHSPVLGKGVGSMLGGNKCWW